MLKRISGKDLPGMPLLEELRGSDLTIVYMRSLYARMISPREGKVVSPSSRVSPAMELRAVEWNVVEAIVKDF